MKSIKPGRGPSMMGAFGSAAVSIFGVIWTISAMSMGAPIFFGLFGVIFVIVGIVQTIYNFTNATSKNRFSEFDITDSTEESDPLNEYFAEKKNVEEEGEPAKALAFCPYCGAEVKQGFQFCAKCGKELPKL